ncbi:hypothetical protein [Clostridium sp. 1xD42-85]|nr:hypothetical protein [Clostridium sp. 1xD42-85]
MIQRLVGYLTIETDKILFISTHVYDVIIHVIIKKDINRMA